jgi:hypothetical protein
MMMMAYILLLTVLRAIVEIPRESIYGVGIRNVMWCTNGFCLVFDINNISIPPLSCNNINIYASPCMISTN